MKLLCKLCGGKLVPYIPYNNLLTCHCQKELGARVSYWIKLDTLEECVNLCYGEPSLTFRSLEKKATYWLLGIGIDRADAIEFDLEELTPQYAQQWIQRMKKLKAFI